MACIAHWLHRGPIGISERCYAVLVSPLNRHLFIQIILFLADDQTNFTVDTTAFALTSRFFLRQTLTFREVDTPSIASLEDSDSDG